MKKPIGFELLEVGNEYEFVIYPNNVKGKLINIEENEITYEYGTGAFFNDKDGNDEVIEGKYKRTLNIEEIQEIKKI